MAAAGTTFGNVIHGSQTLQDVVNIDIGRYRYGHDRNWDTATGKTKFMSGWWMNSATGTSWNHASTPVSDGYDSSWTSTAAYADGHGSFHSDFLWCNIQPGRNYTLYTTLKSSPGGGYNAYFTQSRTCSATHMATAKKADLNRAAW